VYLTAAADNVAGPLSIWLRGRHQPAISTCQVFSQPGPAGAFAQEYTVMRNTLSDNKLYGHEKASQYCISDLTVL
jgi:hypothetical protein